MITALLIGSLTFSVASTAPLNGDHADQADASRSEQSQRGTPAPIVIDERFDDWSPADLVATDPVGDSVTGSFDLARVWARGEGSTLHLSCEMPGEPRSIQSGDGADGSPMIRIVGPDGRAIEHFHRLRQAFELDTNGDPVRQLSWNQVDFALLPTVASDRYEARIDLAPIGVEAGDTVQLSFSTTPWDGIPSGEPNVSYWSATRGLNPDELDTPISLSMTPPTPRDTDFDPDRAPETDLRLVSLNMLRGGLLVPSTATAASRVLAAAAGDIYCLQEQDGTPAQIEAVFNGIDPLGGGETWTALTDPETSVFSSGYIVTHLPVRQITGPDVRPDFVVAVVGNTPADSLLVFSIHMKCCGFAGSGEDAERIGEILDIIDVIERFRAGGFGPDLAPFADVPVVVAGDWNLVGSDEPRRLLTTTGSAPSLDHVTLLRPDGRDATTWRNLGGFSFTPGLLDLVAVSPQNLAVRGGYVLDAQQLDGPTLDRLGLFANDTRFSDHLALVVDLAIRESVADFNDDGVLDLADIAGFAGAFNDRLSQADLDGPDGVHDLGDLVVFVEAFMAGLP
jgi:hypothetical protein